MGSGDPAGLCPKCLILGAFDSSIGAEEAVTETIDTATAAVGDDDFGRYRIVGELGEGGMGTVYLAEQLEPIRRRVALKVVKLGMDTAQVLARFNNERQALAMMEHPSIALDDILEAVARIGPRKVRVVEMRFFDGLSVEESAEVLGISAVTVMRDRSFVNAWLHREMAGQIPMNGHPLVTES